MFLLSEYRFPLLARYSKHILLIPVYSFKSANTAFHCQIAPVNKYMGTLLHPHKKYKKKKVTCFILG